MDLKQLEVNSDRRGTLVEAFKFPNDGQVFYIIAKPHEARGNHYHKRKIEHFLTIYGSAIITVKDRESGNIMKAEVTGQKPMIVSVVPNHTHQFEATDEGAIIIVWVDEQYNKDDPDTYPEEL